MPFLALVIIDGYLNLANCHSIWTGVQRRRKSLLSYEGNKIEYLDQGLCPIVMMGERERVILKLRLRHEWGEEINGNALFWARRLIPNNCCMEKAGIEIASPQPVLVAFLKKCVSWLQGISYTSTSRLFSSSFCPRIISRSWSVLVPTDDHKGDLRPRWVTSISYSH